MRHILTLAVILAALLPGGCRKWNNPLDPQNNRPPSTPSSPSPGNGATHQDTNAVLSWTGGDPDSGDVVFYDVYFGGAAQPPLAQAGLDTNAWSTRGLDFSAVYHWKVVSRDLAGDTAAGPVWSLTTRAENDSNKPPYVPSNPSPGNGAAGQDTGATLSWSGGDPDSGDVVLYDVFFGVSSPPPLAHAGHSAASYDPGNLGFLTQYFWRITARDQAGDSAAGPVWSFTTRAVSDTNRPPYAPSSPAPESGATSRSTRAALSWVCTDPDPEDTLRYDVYFGSTSSPPRVSMNQAGKAYSPGALAYDTDYYWRVVARDNHAAETSGPLWLFRTIAQINVTSPSGGERWSVGSSETIEWNGGTCGAQNAERRAQNGVGGVAYGAWRMASGGRRVADAPDSTVVYYSTDNGASWTRHGRATQPGRHDWTVPGPKTDSARVQVRVYAGSDITSGTSAVFRMFELPTPITVTAPADTTRWREGSAQTVTWTGGTCRMQSAERRTQNGGWRMSAGVDSTAIYYSTNNGVNWTRHGRASQAGRYDWSVPGPATTGARVQVRAYSDSAAQVGTSPAYTVYDSLAPSPITVTAPAAGTRWNIGTVQQVTWTGGTDGMDSTVVYYSSNGGAAWERKGRASAPAEFALPVPGPATDSARVQVRAFCAQSQTSGTSGLFIVAPRYPDSVVATLWTGLAPKALCWSPTGDRVYVSNQGSDTVAVIDGQSNSVVARVRVGDQPGALVFNPTGNKVYVANEGGSSVTVIDGSNNSVLRTLTVGTQPRALGWNAANNKVYCANWSSNTLSIIDASRDTVTKTLGTGSRPTAVCWNQAANKVYVVCAGSNEVTIVDGAGDSVITTLPVSSVPCHAVADTVRNFVYVASQGADKVSVIDGETNTMLAVTTVPGAPCFLAWNPDSRKMYTANRDSDSVSVLSTQTAGVIATVKAGEEPCALVWAPVVNVVYAANSASDDVTVIGGGSNRAEGLVQAGDQPAALCWNPTDRKAYVANYAAGTVTVIGVRE